jgi:carbonic anhydrase
MVFPQPVSISNAQMASFQQAVFSLSRTSVTLANNRPLQPLQARDMFLGYTEPWGYTEQWSMAGPTRWQALYPDCASQSTSVNAAQQSPLDLPVVTPERTGLTGFDNINLLSLKFGAGCSTFRGERRGSKWVASGLDQCTSRVYMSTGGSGEQLVLREIAFRSPSEHTIGGKHADAEVQFVLTRQGIAASVVSVLLTADSTTDDAFLQRLLPYFDGELHTDPNPFDPFTDFFPRAAVPVGGSPATAPFYSYPGSLTEPPCTENVQWMVFVDPVSVSPRQINVIKDGLRQLPQAAASSTNNRPLQARNARAIVYNDALYVPPP